MPNKWGRYITNKRQVTFIREPLDHAVVCIECGTQSKNGLAYWMIEPAKNTSEKHRTYLCLQCASQVDPNSGLYTQIRGALRRP